MARMYDPHLTETQCPTSRAGEGLKLIALRDRRTGRRYEISAGRESLTLGSADACDIVITDPYASAQHCSLQRVGEQRSWFLHDHSKNGTSINGTRVRVAEIRPGGRLSIGETCLEILTEDSGTKEARKRLVGQSRGFLTQIDEALRAARSNCPVLILGETGTGKELVARAVHEASRRSEQAFVPVNCGGIPKELIRSELFGHTKGAFTGATEDHSGLFSQAHRGTIFLDELAELPLDQQPHLLRALDSGLIRRVGGEREELVDTRIVAATNRTQLDSPSSPLRFDIYQRLSAVVIELPPLRERPDDIPLLVESFLRAGEEEYGPHTVPPDVLAELSQHRWLGNIRELRNSTLRAMTLGTYELLVRDFLPEGIILPAAAEALPGQNKSERSPFDAAQARMLEDAYHSHGTIRSAAAFLGMPKSTFADMCKRYGIVTARKASSQ